MGRYIGEVGVLVFLIYHPLLKIFYEYLYLRPSIRQTTKQSFRLPFKEILLLRKPFLRSMKNLVEVDIYTNVRWHH